MVIHIPAHRINVASGKAGEQRPSADRQAEQGLYVPPRRSQLNFIPAPESLATLINSAVAALRRGVLWDRGTILNILV
jgi:hypothetical protein